MIEASQEKSAKVSRGSRLPVCSATTSVCRPKHQRRWAPTGRVAYPSSLSSSLWSPLHLRLMPRRGLPWSFLLVGYHAAGSFTRISVFGVGCDDRRVRRARDLRWSRPVTPGWR